jgi:hypothetical protein
MRSNKGRTGPPRHHMPCDVSPVRPHGLSFILHHRKQLQSRRRSSAISAQMRGGLHALIVAFRKVTRGRSPVG